MKVYGSDICIDCRNYKAIQKNRGFEAEYVDITANTQNLREFLHFRDNEPVFEPVRQRGGKGIPRKNFKNVFNPGFTTKSRGWGLGLTLAKRIIEQYHKGVIFVKDSTIGRGTTFRIQLPLISQPLDSDKC